MPRFGIFPTSFSLQECFAHKLQSFVIANIKRLILSMNKYGRSDRELIMFKENLALAVTGNLSLVKLMVATGLSRRVLQQGKKDEGAIRK